MKFLSTILIIVSVTSICTAANIIYVDVNGPNDPGTGTSGDPFRRIQDAINYAVSGDTVVISPGIYTGSGNYNLDPNGRAITIRSTDPNDPNIIANTIIDPNKAGRGFYVWRGEDSNCVISGLTIKNGLAADGSGGAILCYNSNPTISNCFIKSNAADYGGALFCGSGSPEITNCTMTGNSAIDGGALECWSGTTIIRNCIISNNTASNNGGAIDCYWEGQTELHNCSVVTNVAGTGGALRCVDNGKATIENSIIWSNHAAKGTEIAVESSPFSTSEVTIGYSDMQGGISSVYVDPCSTLVWGGGNIDSDPCFALFDPNGDPNLWDFHLQSAYGRWDPNIKSWVNDSNTSPCIDAGDPNSDWSGELWPNGKRINMGAYGGTAQASKNGNIADFDVNGVVNSSDLMEFCSKWLDENGGIVNLNLAGCVDFQDFAIFAENWLWQRE
jgi:hypothetical protein